jgi:RNA polymerase sigma-70 factor (ECF subfamily)
VHQEAQESIVRSLPSAETPESGIRSVAPIRRPREATRAETDAELVHALREGRAGATAALFDRHGRRIARLIFHVLGPEAESEDVLHEVFLRALEGIGSLEDPSRLGSWLSSIAVLTSRELIRKRARWGWLRVFGDGADVAAPQPSEEVSEALRAAFSVLREMPTDERVVYALRFIDGMELVEIAEALSLSLSTTKRRLKAAQKRFAALARREPALVPWLLRREARENESRRGSDGVDEETAHASDIVEEPA